MNPATTRNLTIAFFVLLAFGAAAPMLLGQDEAMGMAAALPMVGQDAGTGSHERRPEPPGSWRGQRALIAIAGSPPAASLRLASASSDAVPYGPMRTR